MTFFTTGAKHSGADFLFYLVIIVKNSTIVSFMIKKNLFITGTDLFPLVEKYYINQVINSSMNAYYLIRICFSWIFSH